ATSACSAPDLIASTMPPMRSTAAISTTIWSSIWLVRASTKYEPPSGSTVSAAPASSAQICIVRSAISCAFADGIVYASSEVVHVHPAAHHHVDVRGGDGQAVRHLLRRGAARFANVIAADRHGVGARIVPRGVLDQIADEPQ